MFRGIKLIYYFIELMSVMYVILVRLIFSFVALIAQVIVIGAGIAFDLRYGGRGRRFFDTGYDGEFGVNNSFGNSSNRFVDTHRDESTWLADIIRRRKAFKACKRFLTKNKDIYILQNNNVNLSFHTEKGEIVCFNRKNTEQKFKISSFDFIYKIQPFELTDVIKMFNRSFENICSSFNERSTYEGIKEYLKKDYNLYDKTDIKTHSVKTPDNYEAMPRVEDYCENAKKTAKKAKSNVVPIKTIDINTASDEELSALPGINIISAKKIIKYRELHNGFDSKEDFYDKMKINEKIQAKIDNLIVVEKKKNNATIKNESDERIVDL